MRKSTKSYGVVVNIDGKNVIKNVVKVGDALLHKCTLSFKTENSAQDNITLELYEGVSKKEYDVFSPTYNREDDSFVVGDKQKWCGFIEFPVVTLFSGHMFDIIFFVNENGFLYTNCVDRVKQKIDNQLFESNRIKKDKVEFADNIKIESDCSTENEKTKCIYGIDFGLSNCSIAKLDCNGNPEVLQNYVDGIYTLASAVYFEEKTGNAILGEEALDYLEINPMRLIRYAERIR